jgi:hypothetical protein
VPAGVRRETAPESPRPKPESRCPVPDPIGDRVWLPAASACVEDEAMAPMGEVSTRGQGRYRRIKHRTGVKFDRSGLVRSATPRCVTAFRGPLSGPTAELLSCIFFSNRHIYGLLYYIAHTCRGP